MNWSWTVTAERSLAQDLFGPLATLVAVLLAALFAYRQWNLAERQKLRLELYRELSDQVRSAQTAVVELAGIVRAASHELRYLDQLPKRSPQMWSSQIGILDLSSRFRAYESMITETVHAVQQWEAVNPQWEVYRVALVIGSDEVTNAFHNRLLYSAIEVLPPPAGTDTNSPLWNAPTPTNIKEFIGAADDLGKAADQLIGWFADMSVGFQNELVAGLFGNQLSLRNPPDPSVIVLDLSDAQSVLARLKTETAAGQRLEEFRKASTKKFEEKT